MFPTCRGEREEAEREEEAGSERRREYRVWRGDVNVWCMWVWRGDVNV